MHMDKACTSWQMQQPLPAASYRCWCQHMQFYPLAASSLAASSSHCALQAVGGQERQLEESACGTHAAPWFCFCTGRGVGKKWISKLMPGRHCMQRSCSPLHWYCPATHCES